MTEPMLILSGIIAVGIAFVLEGRGGGRSRTEAATGTLGTRTHRRNGKR